MKAVSASKDSTRGLDVAAKDQRATGWRRAAEFCRVGGAIGDRSELPGGDNACIVR